MSSYRFLLLALLCLPLPVLGGCGERDGPATHGVRVRILTSEVDGPIQGTLLLENTGDETGSLYEAVPLAGEPDVFVAEKAPVGTYYVYTSEGWGMLWVGSQGPGAPLLRGADLPATTVRMGKPRSLYIAAEDPRTFHGHVIDQWGADWKVAGSGDGAEGFEKVAIEVEPQGQGLMALRFPEAVWQEGHVIRVCGVYQSGVVSQLVSFVKRGAKVALPRIAFTNPAPLAPLEVVLVGADADTSVPDDLPVVVTLRHVPLEARFEARSHKGVVSFDGIGSLGGGIRIEVPSLGSNGAFEMSQEAWRTQGLLHVLLFDPEGAPSVRLDAITADPVEIRALLPGTTTYGRLPIWKEGGTSYTRAPAGPQAWRVLDADGRWIDCSLEVAASGLSKIQKAEADQWAARIRGGVNGGGRGFEVQFTELVDGGTERGGAGLTARVDDYGKYEIRVPPGRYRLQVLRPGGSPGGRPKVLPLRSKSEVRVDLEAR